MDPFMEQLHFAIEVASVIAAAFATLLFFLAYRRFTAGEFSRMVALGAAAAAFITLYKGVETFLEPIPSLEHEAFLLGHAFLLLAMLSLALFAYFLQGFSKIYGFKK